MKKVYKITHGGSYKSLHGFLQLSHLYLLIRSSGFDLYPQNSPDFFFCLHSQHLLYLKNTPTAGASLTFSPFTTDAPDTPTTVMVFGFCMS